MRYLMIGLLGLVFLGAMVTATEAQPPYTHYVAKVDTTTLGDFGMSYDNDNGTAGSWEYNGVDGDGNPVVRTGTWKLEFDNETVKFTNADETIWYMKVQIWTPWRTIAYMTSNGSMWCPWGMQYGLNSLGAWL